MKKSNLEVKTEATGGEFGLNYDPDEDLDVGTESLDIDPDPVFDTGVYLEVDYQ
jgi:hypothetical protein